MVALAGMTIAMSAQALEFKTTLEAEARAFYEADGSPVPASGSATVELFQAWDDEHQRIVGEFFGRYDDEDDARTHDDVRELYWQVIGDEFEFRLGARRVYWGVVESRHLVDIVNQTDLVEDIDSKSKLGAPMMNLALVHDWGVVDFLLLPYQRARTYPGPDGHPRLPFPVAADEARYESPQRQHHLDYAVRYAGSFGGIDVGLAWFDGTARDPHLLGCLRRGATVAGTAVAPDGPNCNPSAPQGDPLTALLQQAGLAPSDQQIRAEAASQVVLVPYYDRLRQASLDAQWIIDSLALKAEALRRERSNRDTYAFVGGFEWSFGNVPWLNADAGILGEYLRDQDNEALGVLYDDELFAGLRLTFNDEASSQVLAGITGDRSNFRSRFGGIEASRRLGNDWRVALKARMFAEIPDDSIAKFLEKQDFVTVSVERFF